MISAVTSQSRQAVYVRTAAIGIATTVVAFWLYSRRKRNRRRKSDTSELDVAIDKLIQEVEARGGYIDETTISEFKASVAWVGSDSSSGLSNAAKLELYACYKQTLVGDCPPDCPRGIEASYKWEAWHKQHGRSRASAMQGYVEVLNRLAPGWHQGARLDSSEEDSGKQELSMGPTVSMMGVIGDVNDVDASAAGQFCELVAENQVHSVRAAMLEAPQLALLPDKDGMTALHWASDRGSTELVELLAASVLKHTPDRLQDYLNLGDSSGDTALHFAVQAEHKDVAKLLFGLGGDTEKANEDGDTPLSLAEDWDDVREIFDG